MAAETEIIFIIGENPRLRYAAAALERASFRSALSDVSDLKAMRIVDAAVLSERELQRFLQSEDEAKRVRAVLFPVRGTKDGHVSQNGRPADVSGFLKALRPGTALLAAVYSPWLRAVAEKGRLLMLNPYRDPELAKKNAVLTAEAILPYLKEKGFLDRRVLPSFDILGNGRVASAFAEVLLKAGYPFRIAARHGGGVTLEEWKKMRPSDIIVNTIPAEVLTKEDGAHWSTCGRDVVVFDLASGASGMTPWVEALHGVRYAAAPPLPDTNAPEAAGELLADYLERMPGR